MRVDETVIIKVKAKIIMDLLETVDEVLRVCPYQKKPHNLFYELETHKGVLEGMINDD